MNSELKKSLVDLIDETLGELEELKKSRFSAAEIKLDGPGADGIAGKPANGSMGKDEDKDEDKEEDEAEKAEGKNEEAAKAEGKNEEAEKSDKEDKKEEAKDKDEKSMDKAEDKKEPKKDEDKDDKDEMEAKMKKSQEEVTSLMKSFVDERIKPLEDKLSTIVDLVNKLADQPVAPKGATARAMPLAKSAEEFEPLSKGAVTSKLWELKKSGTPVDSLDVTKAEMGQDLESIVKKYKIS